jgi:hypothetical protein
MDMGFAEKVDAIVVRGMLYHNDKKHKRRSPPKTMSLSGPLGLPTALDFGHLQVRTGEVAAFP